MIVKLFGWVCGALTGVHLLPADALERGVPVGVTVPQLSKVAVAVVPAVQLVVHGGWDVLLLLRAEPTLNGCREK